MLRMGSRSEYGGKWEYIKVEGFVITFFNGSFNVKIILFLKISKHYKNAHKSRLLSETGFLDWNLDSVSAGIED